MSPWARVTFAAGLAFALGAGCGADEEDRPPAFPAGGAPSGGNSMGVGGDASASSPDGTVGGGTDLGVVTTNDVGLAVDDAGRPIDDYTVAFPEDLGGPVTPLDGGTPTRDLGAGPIDTGFPVGPADNGFPVGPVDTGFPVGPADNGAVIGPADTGFPVGPADNGAVIGPADLGFP